MKFIYYDLIFLGIFCVFLGIFLYTKRKKLVRENKIFFLYKTKWGIKLINWFSEKVPWLLKSLSWVSIISAYIGMAAMFYLLYETIRIMLILPTMIKIPPIMPLIPYLPQIFKETLLPPFYFTYWIIVLLVVATIHEFSHGIFARYAGVKIKTTGFGFLGPFPLAFVEPEEEKLKKKPIKKQLAMLSAGPFSNIILAIIVLILMQLFFFATYAPSGVIFNDYYASPISIEDIKEIAGTPIDSLNINYIEENFSENMTMEIELKTSEKIYYSAPTMLKNQLENKALNNTLFLYEDAPAYKEKISGAIIKMDKTEVKTIEDLRTFMDAKRPGDIVTICTTENNYTITLIEDPENSTRAFIGIAFYGSSKGALNKMVSLIMPQQKEPFTYYKAKSNEQLTIFIYNLLWWLFMISFSVGLINLLPIGIFDGGRIFYLTILKITKNKKKAKVATKIASFLVIAIFILLLLIWLFKII